MMNTINSVLLEHYKKNPGGIFCRFIKDNSEEDISYRDLIEMSLGYASYFKNINIKKGDAVIIILKHSPHLFYSFAGAMMIGAMHCGQSLSV